MISVREGLPKCTGLLLRKYKYLWQWTGNEEIKFKLALDLIAMGNQKIHSQNDPPRGFHAGPMKCEYSRPRWSNGSEVRGFDPSRGRWIFSVRKNPEYDFLRKGSKAVGPVS